MNALHDIKKLILTTEIHDRIIDSSLIMGDKMKDAFRSFSKYTRELLVKESKINSYGLNSLKNELLHYWHESINPDTERFWAELKRNGVDYGRKETLKFVLEKKRFRRVDHGMEARKYWSELKKLKEIQQKFTSSEIEELDFIISKDEKQRIEILKKCLRKKEIPQTQYLKFGECMAYANNCNLWDKYFIQSDVDELYEIWRNFKSK